MTLNGHEITSLLSGWIPGKNIALRETSWLDGLRGGAAFMVMIDHFSTRWTSHFFKAAFGAEVLVNVNPGNGINCQQKGDRLWGFWRLPFFRLVVSSASFVSVFFIISGFVLSWSAVALIQADEHEKLYHTIGSSVVRRWFRLYATGAVVTIAYMLHRMFLDDPFNRAATRIFLDFFVETEVWANPFSTEHITPFTTGHGYNWVMWTLPVEFGGSMFVFVALFALGRIKNIQRRITAVVFVSTYAMYKLRWDIWMFGTGLALADYVRYHGGFKKLPYSITRQDQQRWCIVLAFSMLLMGCAAPTVWFDNPGYGWISLVPMPPGSKEKLGDGLLIQSFGSILLVVSSCHLTFVREFFERPLLQYLGKISFMLYLIHILVCISITLPFRNALYATFYEKGISMIYEDPGIYDVSTAFTIAVYFLMWAVALPITLVCSHFLEIYVDRPCLAMAKSIDNWLIGNPDPKSPLLVIINDEKSICKSTSGSSLHSQYSDNPSSLKLI